MKCNHNEHDGEEYDQQHLRIIRFAVCSQNSNKKIYIYEV